MSSSPQTGPSPPARRRSVLAIVCRRLDLTVRGVWVLLVAVGLVLLSAAASYVFVFPEPTGGAAAIVAASVAASGFPLLVAGTCGLVADRHGPLATRPRCDRDGGS